MPVTSPVDVEVNVTGSSVSGEAGEYVNEADGATANAAAGKPNVARTARVARTRLMPIRRSTGPASSMIRARTYHQCPWPLANGAPDRRMYYGVAGAGRAICTRQAFPSFTLQDAATRLPAAAVYTNGTDSPGGVTTDVSR